MNQWLRFSQENPWLNAPEFTDAKIWQTFVETARLPRDSDIPFIRTFLYVGDMDFHKCLDAPVITHTALAKAATSFGSNQKLA